MIKNIKVFEVYDKEGNYVGYFLKNEINLAEARAKELDGTIKTDTRPVLM